MASEIETKRKKPFKHRRYLKPLVQHQYIVKCRGCGKRLRDPADNPIYVVRSVEKPTNKKTDEGEYFCSQKCMDKNDPHRKEALENVRELAGEERNNEAQEETEAA